MTGDPVLDHLQRTYGKSWRIWRTPNWWMANPRTADTGVTPTLMERTPQDLEAHMRNPGQAIGRGLVPWPRHP
ncbi:hypothetical protein GCM10007147_21720 [Nocardiopsis kunsanensis]|uniref:Uncharacterized protein n=1 Tax=Nocardiopsis kunsanensis TaxID=141693 RepID=A0A918XC61_9ACTN|nr:hypothetical protein [Nocardiopsis kunsanensis]GHD24965.1 hypothetical protein GCM10007147_21720 [Nocardiopsis kunsanensis]